MHSSIFLVKFLPHSIKAVINVFNFPAYTNVSWLSGYSGATNLMNSNLNFWYFRTLPSNIRNFTHSSLIELHCVSEEHCDCLNINLSHADTIRINIAVNASINVSLVPSSEVDSVKHVITYRSCASCKAFHRIVSSFKWRSITHTLVDLTARSDSRTRDCRENMRSDTVRLDSNSCIFGSG